MTGVYLIASEVSRKGYIGSALSIKHRWAQHRHLLRRGLHHCPHLQAAWNKYGEGSFTFKILKEVNLSQEELLKEEQKFLDNPPIPLYNVCKVATTRKGVRSTKPPEERVLSGISYPSLMSPTGETFCKGRNLKYFCEQHQLPYKGMYSLIRGDKLSCLGWTLKEPFREPKWKISTVPALISPEGVKTDPEQNWSNFLRKHNLDHAGLYWLVKGRWRSHKGWRLADG